MNIRPFELAWTLLKSKARMCDLCKNIPAEYYHEGYAVCNECGPVDNTPIEHRLIEAADRGYQIMCEECDTWPATHYNWGKAICSNCASKGDMSIRHLMPPNYDTENLDNQFFTYEDIQREEERLNRRKDMKSYWESLPNSEE